MLQKKKKKNFDKAGNEFVSRTTSTQKYTNPTGRLKSRPFGTQGI
jgi:hypothetical protein